jgi:Tfp pilus assembly protein PilV
MKNIKYDNKGLSLVELIIAIAIAALVFLVIMVITTFSMSQYKNISTDASLQNEALLTSNQIRDLLMEVDKGISWDEDNSKLSLYYVENDQDNTQENDQDMVGVIEFDSDKNELTYKIYEYKVDTEEATEPFILSKNISSFDCNTDKVFTNNIIEYEIEYKVEEETWKKTNEFTFRNTVRVVDTPNEIFDN